MKRLMNQWMLAFRRPAPSSCSDDLLQRLREAGL
jgi:hypothetical protein